MARSLVTFRRMVPGILGGKSLSYCRILMKLQIIVNSMVIIHFMLFLIVVLKVMKDPWTLAAAFSDIISHLVEPKMKIKKSIYMTRGDLLLKYTKYYS